jgi:hypothetical protein
MNWIRRLFWIAGIYGLIVIAPQYIMEHQIGVESPPPITHLEYFYGFIGVGLAWQVAFLVIATDPLRFRPMMIPAVVEKFTFAGAAAVLFVLGKIPIALLGFGAIDFILGVMFLVAFWSLR